MSWESGGGNWEKMRGEKSKASLKRKVIVLGMHTWATCGGDTRGANQWAVRGFMFMRGDSKVAASGRESHQHKSRINKRATCHSRRKKKRKSPCKKPNPPANFPETRKKVYPDRVNKRLKYEIGEKAHI